jgi:hypothetical protein
MSEYTKHRTARKREFFAYDGTIFIGRILVDEKTGKARGFNATGRLLGEFPDYHSARRAVSGAYREVTERKTARAKATAEALDRINRPHPEFKSGWPSW